MKKMIKVMILALFSCMGSVWAMESSFLTDNEALGLYIVVKNHLNMLQREGSLGFRRSAIAAFDFYQSIDNPSYKIPLKVSKEYLISLGWLDYDGKICPKIRYAFTLYDNVMDHQ